MKSFKAIFTGYFLLILQTSSGVFINRDFVTPNLVFPFVLYLGAIDFGSSRGTAISFLFGYLLDLLSGSPTGIHAFVLSAMYLLVRTVYAKMMFQGAIFQILLTFISSVVGGLMIIGMRALLQRSALTPSIIPVMVLGNSITTSLIAPFVFRLGKAVIPESPKKREEKVVL